jgi:hypothetical protein
LNMNFGFQKCPGVRPPAAANRFYSGDAEELRRTIESMLAEAAPQAVGGKRPKAIIVPHAGYMYSGPIAAAAYSLVRQASDQIRTVVVIGPSHFVAMDGLAASPDEAFETPLGRVPVDQQSIERLTKLPRVTLHRDAHAQEHSVEVQLPFLQVILREFSLVPLVAGGASAEDVGGVLEAVWGGPETLIVISSDLSHYRDYETARRLDRATAKAIEALDPSAVHHDEACGCIPVRGILLAGRTRGMKVRTLDLRNSGDTAGPRHQVVGYGAFAFEGSE